MEQKILEEFQEDLKEFYEITEKFYAKEITVPQYKSFSGGFGSYAQRGGERSMLRLRLSGGEITKEHLKFIADSIEKYKITMAHLTTCQTVQLHNLTKEEVCGLIADAFDHGIITRGGGGDFPRNVMCSPLSGVTEQENFDVLPYAKEAADYLITLIKKVKLPRKLKVCFSGGGENLVHATFRDLGFVARKDGMFDVYCAGGLGIKPKFGVLVAEHVDPVKILYCIKTMVDIFTEHGNYENRAASRTRFLQDTLGIDGLKKAFADQLAENLLHENLDIKIQEITVKKRGQEEAGFEQTARVIKQKQPGLYAVSYHPVGGTPKVDFFGTLYKTISDMEEIKVRLSPDEGMYIINLTKEEAKKVLKITGDGAETEFDHSTACIGADVCQVGIGRSQVLLKACVARAKEAGIKDKALPRIHISGCPSSCSAHQTAAIGLRGGKKPTPEGPKYAFALYENGSEEYGKEQFGTEIGVMLEDDIPEFFVDLGHAVEAEGLTYDEFRSKYPEKLTEIAKKYL